jgi:hypothetical protein
MGNLPNIQKPKTKKTKNNMEKNQITEKNILPGECCPKTLGIFGLIGLVFAVFMLYLCYHKNTTKTQPDNPITSLFVSEQEPTQFFLSLVSTDYMQDEISYAPRFVQGKVISHIALAEEDSVVLFTPSDKMSDKEYNHWIGRSRAAYEYVTGKVE